MKDRVIGMVVFLVIVVADWLLDMNEYPQG